MICEIAMEKMGLLSLSLILTSAQELEIKVHFLFLSHLINF